MAFYFIMVPRTVLLLNGGWEGNKFFKSKPKIAEKIITKS